MCFECDFFYGTYKVHTFVCSFCWRRELICVIRAAFGSKITERTPGETPGSGTERQDGRKKKKTGWKESSFCEASQQLFYMKISQTKCISEV